MKNEFRLDHDGKKAALKCLESLPGDGSKVMDNSKKQHDMKHLDLFSGIGGFALAAQWAGFETVAFCEIEDYPRRVLEKNFPGVPIHRDVRDIDGSDYAGTNLITGGYPCQPFSLAGKRGGEEDDRHLWPEMFRIIKQARPAWVVAENVVGHVSMGLDQVLSDLESEGYAARPVIIPACAVDAPHRRDRVWIIANAGGEQYQGSGDEDQREKAEEFSQDLANTKGSNDRCGNSREGERQEQEPGNSCCKSDVSNAACQLQHWSRTVTEQAGRREFTDYYRWPVEPRVDRVANGIPSRVDRLKGLGNAIVPQVAYEILLTIRSV